MNCNSFLIVTLRSLCYNIKSQLDCKSMIIHLILKIEVGEEYYIAMTLLESILLGVLQGILEFLPVSSYGQLLFAEHLLQIEKASIMLFEIFLHIGSAIAIAIVFRKDIKRIYQAFQQMMPAVRYNIRSYFYNLLHEQEERSYQHVMRNNYQKFAGMLLISSISCAVTGYLLHELSLTFSDSLLSVGLSFLITAVVLLVVDLWKHGTVIPDGMTWWQAVLIGVCHGLGVIPGISSLGITICVCLLCGLRKNFAIRYSFLLFIAVSIGALFFRFHEFAEPQMTLQLGAIYIVGMITSAVVSLLCARLMLKILIKKRLRIFAIYSFLVGLFVIVYNFM